MLGAMASFRAIAATGRTLERLLNACFDADEPVAGKNTRAVLVNSDDFDLNGADNPIVFPALSLFLYRTEVNKAMRAAWSGVAAVDGRARLPLDLHYLLTAWADNAEFEHAVLGKTMECLETTPILSGPQLYPAGDWAPNEAVQIVSGEAATDSIVRTFESLDANFRLSVQYIARVVRIDAREAFPDPTVTAAVTGASPSVA
jgi:hypothetical protein